MTFVYLVPHCHYDAAWAFTKEDYLLIFELVLKKAIELIRSSDFAFLIEQTFPLEEIEQRDPELFSDIKQAIAAGKIEIVDGQYLMADPMIPYGEVLIREILYGKRYCKKKFNVDIPVAWAADGFGLNAQMPQIYRKSGYRWLAFRRGLPKSIGSRVSEFLWEGIDGSTILSHWMPLGYRAGLELDDWEQSCRTLSSLATTDCVLMPCGSGGVPPQKEIPDEVQKWNRTHPKSPMIVTTPRSFFEHLDTGGAQFTTFRGELYSAELESIFPDVVSSRISLKLAIRESENALVLAEKLATIAFIEGKQYPAEIMNNLWKKMLFLASHDIMPSCGIDEIYDEAWEYIADIRKLTDMVVGDSVSHLLEDESHGTAVVVVNPNNWRCKDWVEVDLKLGPGWSREPGIACEGQELRSEVVKLERWDDGSVKLARIGFIADVPSFGYRVYKVDKKCKSFRRTITVTGNVISTKDYTITIDPQSGIIHVFDKGGTQIMKGNELIVDQEVGDLYFHESKLDQYIGSESGPGIRFGAFKPKGMTVEKGPLSTVITFATDFYCLRWPYYLLDKFKPVLYRQKNIEVRKQVIVYENSPRIDFLTSITVKQSHIRVRLKFDSCMITPEYTRQTQFGSVRIPAARTLEESVKVPSLTWIACEENRRGLAFFTHGVPINEIRGGEIYLTLLRSVSVLSADGKSGPFIPTPGALELGEHTYAYSIYPYQGTWEDAQVHRQGSLFSQSLLALQFDTSPQRQEYTTLTVEPHSIIITALKKAEDDNALILRFFEAVGKPCLAELTLPACIKRAEYVNLLEEKEHEAEINNGRLLIQVSPFEIVTLKLFLGSNPPLASTR